MFYSGKALAVSAGFFHCVVSDTITMIKRGMNVPELNSHLELL